ncbi:HupE/UreJ family protein [Paracraurococcus lichenis]|uniref:HupE/UreJ family protein n=1 Tax=Paracraurococcus lichenis TaxID=3064888 RepID=A0ABT9E2F0_9PROT|nr:HupE/UreJ family protein [Paracraurococcus sp. LOR1-02]MDO9710349.1 HupE/UreJ family protein [Paracraurococcus sp. LOR1-02]
MTRFALPAAALLLPATAFAHPGHLEHAGFLAGLLHPVSGLDHLLAMVMVGLWAGLLGGAARLALPGAFLAAMLAGFGLAAAGLVLPGVEAGILASVVVLAAFALLAVRVPVAAAAGLVALAGLFHGHAHGTEMLGGVAPYAAGFLLATAALHAAGLALAAPLARHLGTRLAARTA